RNPRIQLCVGVEIDHASVRELDRLAAAYTGLVGLPAEVIGAEPGEHSGRRNRGSGGEHAPAVGHAEILEALTLSALQGLHAARDDGGWAEPRLREKVCINRTVQRPHALEAIDTSPRHAQPDERRAMPRILVYPGLECRPDLGRRLSLEADQPVGRGIGDIT